jgi:WD40 repeat protein
MKPYKQRKLLAVSLLPLALVAALLCLFRGTGQKTVVVQAAVLKGHRLPVQALAFSPDGTTLASAAFYFNAPESATEVVTWDAGGGTLLAKHTEHLKRIDYLAFAPGGRRLAAAQGSSLWLWETAYSHEKGRQCDLPVPANALTFSGDGAQLAVADFKNGVSILDVADGQTRACRKGQDEAVYCLAFSRDGAVLASGGWGGTIGLWDTASGEERGVLLGHTKPVLSLAFTPDGRTLAAGDLGGVAKLWDLTAKAVRATLGTFEDEVAAVAFSPDGGTLAVAAGRTVRLWDVGARSLVANLEGHEGGIKSLAYSPDGTLLASGGFDKTVRLWRLAQAARP